MSRAERGPEPAPRRGRWSPDLVADVMTYAVAALLPLGVIAWLMRLWTLDLTVPFLYGGDALSTQAGVKNLLETGSIYVNRLLGAPGVSELYEVPGADLFHLLTLRLFGLLGAAR